MTTHPTPTAPITYTWPTEPLCGTCGVTVEHIPAHPDGRRGGWRHTTDHGGQPHTAHPAPPDGPAVPGGADPAELCQRHRINGHTCLWSVAQQGGGWLCDACTEQLRHMNAAAGVDR